MEDHFLKIWGESGENRNVVDITTILLPKLADPIDRKISIVIEKLRNTSSNSIEHIILKLCVLEVGNIPFLVYS